MTSNINNLIIDAPFLTKINVHFENPEIITSISLSQCQFPECL